MKNVKRAMEIYRLRLDGKTLKEIGIKFGLTRERVRQIIKIYYPEYKHPKKTHILFGVPCANSKCANTFSKKNFEKRIYCSIKCSAEHRRKNRTEEERKAILRERCLKYYHAHKHLPHFIKKRRQYNKNANEKRKSRNL